MIKGQGTRNKGQVHCALRITHYALLFALFVAEMSFYHLPKILHEILGVAMAAAIILHVAINRRRFASLLKKLTPRKFFNAATDFALTICAAIILISGVFMSNYLFAELVSFELRRNMTFHQLHVAAPYAMLILIGVHIGLHWRELRQRILNLFGLEEIFRTKIIAHYALRIAHCLLSLFGVAGLYLNRVGDRILMKHIFATPATELPAAVFALLTIGGVIFFATITFLLDEKIFRRGRD